MKEFIWVCSPKEEGTALMGFVAQKMEHNQSKRQIKQMIEKGTCLVNQKIERFSSRKLKVGDRVQFSLLTLSSEEIKFHKDLLLYEHPDFIVIDKPVGFEVSQENVQTFFKNSGYRCFAVHRLDRETSGALILARNHESQKKIEDLFKNKEIHKKYLAIVEGTPHKQQGEISLPLLKKHIAGQVVVQAHPKGIPSLTLWKSLEILPPLSLIELSPITGRTHQIRVHLKSMGWPILGDDHYHRSFSFHPLPPRCLLHARSIAFCFKGESFYLEASIPQDMTHYGFKF